MPGNKIGGLKAAATNKERHGKDFYKKIGSVGGKNGHTGGFRSNLIGSDGLTGRERARIAGAKGGRLSKRGPTRVKTPVHPSVTVLGNESHAPSGIIHDVIRRFKK